MRIPWHLIAVIVVPIIVGILANLFRGKEAADQRKQGRPGTDPRRDRARTDSSGIDQFLEEIRRRQNARQEAAEETQREMRKPRPVPDPPPVRAPRPTKVPREVPVVTVVTTPAAEMDVPEVIPLMRPASKPTPRKESPENSTRTQIAALLKSGQGLRTAFVLREIFDAPLCKRRRT